MQREPNTDAGAYEKNNEAKGVIPVCIRPVIRGIHNVGNYREYEIVGTPYYLPRGKLIS